jgi:hypothetical protein
MDNAYNDEDEFKHLIKNILDTNTDLIVYEYLRNKNNIDRLQILSINSEFYSKVFKYMVEPGHLKSFFQVFCYYNDGDKSRQRFNYIEFEYPVSYINSFDILVDFHYIFNKIRNVSNHQQNNLYQYPDDALNFLESIKKLFKNKVMMKMLNIRITENIGIEDQFIQNIFKCLTIYDSKNLSLGPRRPLTLFHLLCDTLSNPEYERQFGTIVNNIKTGDVNIVVKKKWKRVPKREDDQDLFPPLRESNRRRREGKNSAVPIGNGLIMYTTDNGRLVVRKAKNKRRKK